MNFESKPLDTANKLETQLVKAGANVDSCLNENLLNKHVKNLIEDDSQFFNVGKPGEQQRSLQNQLLNNNINNNISNNNNNINNLDINEVLKIL